MIRIVNVSAEARNLHYTKSMDHGASFGPNVRVTIISSNPNTLSDPSFIGDHIGLASDTAGMVHPIWNGGENGLCYTFTAVICATPISTTMSSASSAVVSSASSITSYASIRTAETTTLENAVTISTGGQIGTIIGVAIFSLAAIILLRRRKGKGA